MMAWKRWQDWAVAILGVLLFLSPFAFGDTAMTTAAWTAYVGGVLLVIFGLVSLANPAARFSEWIDGIVGVLVFISPWVVGFSTAGALAWSAWIIGILTVLLAASVLFGPTRSQPTMATQR